MNFDDRAREWLAGQFGRNTAAYASDPLSALLAAVYAEGLADERRRCLEVCAVWCYDGYANLSGDEPETDPRLQQAMAAEGVVHAIECDIRKPPHYAPEEK